MHVVMQTVSSHAVFEVFNTFESNKYCIASGAIIPEVDVLHLNLINSLAQHSGPAVSPLHSTLA